MPLPNLGALRAVADRLDRLGLSYAFVGGSIVNLLLDEPGLSPALLAAADDGIESRRCYGRFFFRRLRR